MVHDPFFDGYVPVHVYVFQNIRFTRAYSRYKLTQDHWYHKLHKAISSFTVTTILGSFETVNKFSEKIREVRVSNDFSSRINQICIDFRIKNIVPFCVYFVF